MKHQLPYYELEGQRYPRLTRILGILREPDIAPDILETSAEDGRQGHTMIQVDLLVGKWKVPAHASAKQIQMAAAYSLWKREQASEFKPTYVEHQCLSTSFGYGATVDAVDIEKLEVFDWKFTSQIRAKHWLQVNAEIPLLFPPEVWQKVKRRVVRFDKYLGVYEQPPFQYFSMEDFEIFLKLKEVYIRWYSHEMYPVWQNKPQQGIKYDVNTQAPA